MTMLHSVIKRSKLLAKCVLHEAQIHLARHREISVGPKVVLFPSNSAGDASSNLRVYLAAPELRRLGWRVVVVPDSLDLSQRRRILRLEQPDVIFMNQTRHPLNRPKLYAPIPIVLDADDADYLDHVSTT